MRFNTISSILFVSGLICINLVFILWRRRKVRGAKWLSLVMLAMSVWGLSAAFEMASVSIEAKMVWTKIQYLGVAVSSPLLFIFAFNHLNVQHSEDFRALEEHKTFSPSRLAPILWIIPLATIILAWTNDFHHLMWTGYHMVTVGSVEALIYSHGSWFWVFLIFTYTLLALSIFMLVMAAIRMWKTARNQAITLLVSLPLPVIANMMYVFFPDQLKGVDLTPVGFAFTGVILAVGIFNFYLLDLTPFAREILMEFLPEAVIVVDSQNRVLDLNASFFKMLGGAYHLQIGDSVDRLLDEWLTPEQAKSTSGQYQITIFFGHEFDGGENHSGGTKRIFDICFTPFKYKGMNSGRILILSDITERIASEDLLFETNEKLNAQLVEIHILKDQIEELAVRDALTGLYNRRFLNDTLSREFSRAGREHYTISVAMIDVDHFKNYNDTFGHQAGDEVLVKLAKHLLDNVREGDVVVRYGGEEFIILFPFISSQIAENRINSLRESFSRIRHRSDDHEGVTFSAGIASFPIHGATFDEVLKAADQALYHAKQAGRNRVAIKDLESTQSG